MRAMARTDNGVRRTLIELKAVDAAYPLYGSRGPLAGQTIATALRSNDGAYGAAVDPAILSRLGLAIGDRVKIGEALLQHPRDDHPRARCRDRRPHLRPAGADCRAGARRDRADPAGRAGDLSLPGATAVRGEPSGLGQFGTSRLSGSRAGRSAALAKLRLDCSG